MSVGAIKHPWIAIAAVAFMACGGEAEGKQCYDVSKGEPKSLSGILQYVLFPGPPNYEDVQKGDTPEPTYVLRLDSPICVKGDEFSDPDKIFDKVQVVGSDSNWPLLKQNLNRHVIVALKDQMGASTGHHHEPLVAWVTSVKSVAHKLDFVDEYGTPATAIRTFYEALADGQGDVAASMVIPEKRAEGPLAGKNLTRFYGSLQEPIHLLGIDESGPSTFVVHYKWANKKNICNGAAIVKTTIIAGRNYIKAIKALDGC